jgi:hypothetical protein
MKKLEEVEWLSEDWRGLPALPWSKDEKQEDLWLS